MDIEQLVDDMFAAHEHLAPHEDEVMSAVHRRIEQPRQAYARPLAVAATVAIVAGAGYGVAALTGRHDQSRHASSGAAAASSQRTHAPARSQATTITSLTMPYNVGWLPDGSVSYVARRINVGGTSESSRPSFDGEYMLTVATPTGVIDIDVQQMPGGLEGVRFKSGPGASITVNGRSGVESANSDGPGGYEVYFLDSTGGLMYVKVALHGGDTGSTAELTAIGRRVARNIGFPGTARVKPTFGVGYVPAGLRVRAFDIEDGAGMPGSGHDAGITTSYDLGTAADQDSVVSVGTATAGPSDGRPGRPVQGHPTRYAVDHGYLTLDVLDAVNGDPVAIPTRLPLAEIYKIADGLDLPN